MLPITLVIMAAGIGSRYGGLKQIDPVGPLGTFIIDYSIYDAIRAGFNRVVFIISPEIEFEFKRVIGQRIETQIEVAYAIQDTRKFVLDAKLAQGRIKPWGTAHAVLCCKDIISSPFSVINADDFYGPSSFVSLYEYLSHAQDRGDYYDYCMVGYDIENTLTEHGHVARGLCSIDMHGNLKDIQERTKITAFTDGIKYEMENTQWVLIPPKTIVSMNLWGFTPSIFAEMGQEFQRFLARKDIDLAKYEYFIPSVVNNLIQNHKATVKVLPSTEKWFGVTYAPDKARVVEAIRSLIETGVYPEQLWKT